MLYASRVNDARLRDCLAVPDEQEDEVALLDRLIFAANATRKKMRPVATVEGDEAKPSTDPQTRLRWINFGPIFGLIITECQG
jgi:hypothetical protein